MNNEIKTKSTGYTNVVRTQEEFGVNDEKGRAIGALVKTFEEEFAPTEDKYSGCTLLGVYFGFRPWATRDGKTFGAVQHEKHFATAAERDAAVAKYLQNARKRAQKKGTP